MIILAILINHHILANSSVAKKGLLLLPIAFACLVTIFLDGVHPMAALLWNWIVDKYLIWYHGYHGVRLSRNSLFMVLNLWLSPRILLLIRNHIQVILTSKLILQKLFLMLFL